MAALDPNVCSLLVQSLVIKETARLQPLIQESKTFIPQALFSRSKIVSLSAQISLKVEAWKNQVDRILAGKEKITRSDFDQLYPIDTNFLQAYLVDNGAANPTDTSSDEWSYVKYQFNDRYLLTLGEVRADMEEKCNKKCAQYRDNYRSGFICVCNKNPAQNNTWDNNMIVQVIIASQRQADQNNMGSIKNLQAKTEYTDLLYAFAPSDDTNDSGSTGPGPDA